MGMLDHDSLIKIDGLTSKEINEIASEIFELKPHHAFFLTSKIKDDFYKLKSLIQFSESLISKNDNSCDLIIKFILKHINNIEDVLTKINSICELVPILYVVDLKKATSMSDSIINTSFNIDDYLTRITALSNICKLFVYKQFLLKENCLANFKEYLMHEISRLYSNHNDLIFWYNYIDSNFYEAEDHIKNLINKSIISKKGTPLEYGLIITEIKNDNYPEEVSINYLAFENLGMNLDGSDFFYTEKLSENEEKLKECCEQIAEICLDKHLSYEEKNNSSLEDLDLITVSRWLSYM